jgi:hypothetical protein
VVQLVMLTLVAASVTSWIMIFQRSTCCAPVDVPWRASRSASGRASTCPSCTARPAATRTRIRVSSRSSVPVSRSSPACASSQASIRKR